ncbi:unnamed protein product [Prunus armeniaca]|uniref:Uncharacterized protein n=1 Tax=Prunus armeniaca TaxID=36596 RepID=A0A6J5U774_PRUAR|nr:unnamed protein product [Prunus armeniaca]
MSSISSRVQVSIYSGGSLLLSSKGSTSNNPEWNVKELHHLCVDLHVFLSQEYDSSHHAEASVSETSQCPNYSLTLFNIVAQPLYDEKIRHDVKGHRPDPMGFFKLSLWARLRL